MLPARSARRGIRLSDLPVQGPEGDARSLPIVGGLLGQSAVWTHAAVGLHRRARRAREGDVAEHVSLERLAPAMTDANGAIFDARNGFRGCIPGIHEVLRRSGFLRGTWCFDARETLSPGQFEQIDRVLAAYPILRDDEFVAAHLDTWMS